MCTASLQPRCFNSRLREEATQHPGLHARHGAVSTHASVRRRREGKRKPAFSLSFNSRLREEATLRKAVAGKGYYGFNSRLREEATFSRIFWAIEDFGFNSRLREEATPRLRRNHLSSMRFQLTPP